MGALHAGHLSLIAKSKAECNLTVCSIFVNPTQFNDPGDLARYPRTPAEDNKILEEAGCDALFSPDVDEMYPASLASDLNLGPIADVLEGSHRPGHFAGVAQVVKRLFEIVQPHRAYFGSKDYQQVLVIRQLVKLMGSPIEVVACPIIREPDGLAMSSRNVLLSPQERSAAGEIPGIMHEAARLARSQDIKAAHDHVKAAVSNQPLMKLEYFEVCDPFTLRPQTGRAHENAIALIAVRVNKIRLIDNLPISAGFEAATGRQALSQSQG